MVAKLDEQNSFEERLQVSVKCRRSYSLPVILEKQLDGCIVWNAHNTVLGEEAPLIYIVPVWYVKTGRYGRS